MIPWVGEYGRRVVRSWIEDGLWIVSGEGRWIARARLGLKGWSRSVGRLKALGWRGCVGVDVDVAIGILLYWLERCSRNSGEKTCSC